jgi:hypothetical protein
VVSVTDGGVECVEPIPVQAHQVPELADPAGQLGRGDVTILLAAISSTLEDAQLTAAG